MLFMGLFVIWQPFMFVPILVVLASLLMHEYSHVWMALRLGFRVSHVMVHPFGAAAMVEDDGTEMVRRPKAEMAVAVAGPLMSLLCALCALLIFRAWPSVTARWAVYANVGMFLFNMLPIYPMDGGRILNGFVSWAFGRKTAFWAALAFSAAAWLAAALFFIHAGWVFGFAVMGLVAWISFVSLAKLREVVGKA